MLTILFFLSIFFKSVKTANLITKKQDFQMMKVQLFYLNS